jgi:predicted DNA-binding transcriptional regulator AlpA
MAKANDTDPLPASRVLRRRTVEAQTGLSRSTIYARMTAGTFPPAICLGGRSVGWLSAEIEAWIADRVAESRSSSTYKARL